LWVDNADWGFAPVAQLLEGRQAAADRIADLLFGEQRARE
jgi:hypothetical protein